MSLGFLSSVTPQGSGLTLKDPAVYGLTRVHCLFFLCGCFSKRRDHWADVEVSNSAAAVKKRREKSSNTADETDKQPQTGPHVESVDTVGNVPIETESFLKHKE